MIRALLLALAACTSIGNAPETPDATIVARTDAAVDAPPPPRPDAAPPQDAAPADSGCAPQVTQLLANRAFDLTPLGTGWQQTLAVAGSPLITTDDGVVEHTAPAKVWLGGYEALVGTIDDAVEQQVAIPALTSQLVLTGVYDVRSGEAPTTIEYDTAKLVVSELDGTPIATVLALSNKTTKTAWAAFAYAFTQNLSGKTVRVRLMSSNDDLDPTSFYFDSLAVTATHGCAPN